MRRFALSLIALSFVGASHAQECEWSTGEFYSGSDLVFGTMACAMPDAAFFAMSCGSDGEISIMYDLAKTTDEDFETFRSSYVLFSTESGDRILKMWGSANGGEHHASIPRDDRLLDALAASETLTLSDEGSVYPIRKVSLAGSRAAITKLLAYCE